MVLRPLRIQLSGHFGKVGCFRRWLSFGALGVVCSGLLASQPAAAVTKAASRARHNRHSVILHAPRHVRFIKWNPLFPGSHDLLVQQNVELDKLQLPRIADEYELMQYERLQDLVPVSETSALKIAEVLPDNRRYCRPWTRDFLQDFSQAFYSEFGSPILSELSGTDGRPTTQVTTLQPLRCS